MPPRRIYRQSGGHYGPRVRDLWDKTAGKKNLLARREAAADMQLLNVIFYV